MTDADKPAFSRAFSTLAVALREPKPDAITLKVYWGALKDLEIEWVVGAAERLMRSSWFPKASEWHAAAAKVEAERVEAQRKFMRQLREPLCLACSDTGWLDDGPGLTNDHKHAPSVARRCDCSTLRRLELLGRRPWPELPSADTPAEDIEPAEATSLLNEIKRRTGVALVLRTMGETYASKQAKRDDRGDRA